MLFWEKESVSSDIHEMLLTLSTEYPICEGRGNTQIVFIPETKEDGISTRTTRNPDGSWSIAYQGTIAAARGVGAVLAGVESNERHGFERFGVMLDCSRDMVMQSEVIKRYLRRLALSGCNMLMLYTEDTYQLPDEPYFGYLRGSYSIAEIQEIDAYAATLGIEVIGCIQTLGHLEQILKWNGAYDDIKDTERVIRTDTSRTYELIAKMIEFWNQALRSRSIHIGMDESHDLGRGKYLDHNGFTDQFKLFNAHLDKVACMCCSAGLEPMIWSDMFFRMSNPEQDYYSDVPLSQEIQASIPRNASLVYWDYYHESEDFYLKFIEKHRAIGFEPVVASGVWTWAKFWVDMELSERTVRPCINACRKAGVKDFFYTMWGDDGAYCDWQSSLAGLFWAAELAYGDAGNEAKRFEAACHCSYAGQMLASKINYHYKINNRDIEVRAPVLLWDDPLFGAAVRNYQLQDADFIHRMITCYSDFESSLNPYRGEKSAGNIDYVYTIIVFLRDKLMFHEAIQKAYHAKNLTTLSQLRNQVPELLKKLERVDDAMREVYLSTSKPFGLEVLQIRNAGQAARIKECGQRLDEFLTGKIVVIPELEVTLPADAKVISMLWYRHTAAGTSWL